jgi:hypothetical protein
MYQKRILPYLLFPLLSHPKLLPLWSVPDRQISTPFSPLLLFFFHRARGALPAAQFYWAGRTMGWMANITRSKCVTAVNLSVLFRFDENGTRRDIAQILARFSLLMLGAEALTLRIVERVWGSNPVTRRNLGGTHGDLALIRRRLISLAVVANNMFHLWLTTPFNDAVIIPTEGLAHVPPGMRDILTMVKDNTSAIYVRKPLHDGQNRINILLEYLRSSSTEPSSLTFEDIVVSWFKDLLFGDNQAKDQTGVDNRIFQAYGYTF